LFDHRHKACGIEQAGEKKSENSGFENPENAGNHMVAMAKSSPRFLRA
jgi:hypothetical protein